MIFVKFFTLRKTRFSTEIMSNKKFFFDNLICILYKKNHYFEEFFFKEEFSYIKCHMSHLSNFIPKNKLNFNCLIHKTVVNVINFWNFFIYFIYECVLCQVFYLHEDTVFY